MNADQVRTPVLVATLTATTMIAHQVGGKATRDAFFLSNYEVTSLPGMVVAAALTSIVLVFMTTRAMTRMGPARVVPVGFALSAALHGLEWALALTSPKTAAVLVYFHTAVFGLILISGFWSLITERFDPRTARKRIARIAGGGTLGGLLGGILAERVGASFDVVAMLPVLSLLHIVCAGAAWRFAVSTHRPVASRKREEASGVRTGLRSIKEVPYLRHLALVVGLGTMGATLVDYVLKAEATSTLDEATLIRFFAVFYTGVSLVTFLVQSGLSRVFLSRLGLSRTVASLPLTLFGTSLAALFVPGLGTAIAVRGGEAVVRSSLFRSGYELHYTPLPKGRKRSTKTLVDVGFERLGDGIGGGLVFLVLLALPVAVRPTLLVLSILLAVASLWIIRYLHRGYVRALEESLLNRATDLKMEDVADSTTRVTLLKTLSGMKIDSELLADAGTLPPAKEPGRVPSAKLLADPLLTRLADLRSADPARVRRSLEEPLEPSLVPQAIHLLAWDEVSEAVVRALARVGPGIAGQLSDALLDPDEEFAIRRRVPRVLSTHRNKRSARILFDGLADKRFEVRFQCGRALARIQSSGVKVPVTSREVYKTVQAEVHVDRRVWEGRRLLEKLDDKESLFVDEVLKERANRSLEHVFTVLSLTLPRQPLSVAFRGLHTDDPGLRGTALEYLESVLPPSLRKSLWPFLESGGRAPSSGRDRKEALEDLLRSNDSIRINLAKLRRETET